MQNPKIVHKKLHYFYTAIFGYFHWISIPWNVFITEETIHKDKYKNYYIQASGRKFYLPQEVAVFIFQLKS